MTYIDEVFGRGGLLDEHSDNYEVRPGQIELARAFSRAIEARRPLMAEGPPGVGKSFAHLVPAIYHSAVNHIGRAIIVTANIALQEQLVRKDLPFLQNVLPWPFTFGLAKGKNNYLCVYKRQELIKKLNFDDEGELLSDFEQKFKPVQMKQIRRLLSWSLETMTGDKSDLEFGSSDVWWLFSSSQDDCLGQDCPFAKSCFANMARKQAMGADVVVMNYHLRFVGEGAMTPEHAIMVCDEAHEAANIARDFLGWTLTVNRINRIAHWLRKNDDKILAIRLQGVGSKFFMDIAEMMDKQSIMRLYDPAWADVDELVACLELTSKIAAELAEKIKADMCCAGEGEQKKLKIRKAVAEKMGKDALTLAFQFRAAVDLSLEGWVFWATQDRKQQRYAVEARPIEVADIISGMFFPTATHSVMLISATMTSGGSFNYVRGELGVPEEAGEIVAPSPFDLRKQGLLLIPKEMSPPPTYGDRQSELAFQNDVCYYSEELIKMCGGRTLLLFSSWKNLDYVYDYLLNRSNVCNGLTLFKQGQKPRMRLVAEFKEDETSVLLGVASFWTGVDIPGRSLTGLLIDKIPFGRPSDPVNRAISELLKSKGKNVFMERAVPEATIKLRQGAGRLIRTCSDVGIVVITDTRLLNTGYGDSIVSSLPEFVKVRSLEKAKTFAERLLRKS